MNITLGVVAVPAGILIGFVLFFGLITKGLKLGLEALLVIYLGLDLRKWIEVRRTDTQKARQTILDGLLKKNFLIIHRGRRLANQLSAAGEISPATATEIREEVEKLLQEIGKQGKEISFRTQRWGIHTRTEEGRLVWEAWLVEQAVFQWILRRVAAFVLPGITAEKRDY